MKHAEVEPRQHPEEAKRDDPTRAATLSIVLTAARCLLTYIALPLLLPAATRSTGAGPLLGLVTGSVAIVFNVRSIQSFRRSSYSWGKWIISLNCVIIALLIVLAINDVRRLLA